MLAQYGTSVFNDQLQRNLDDEEEQRGRSQNREPRASSSNDPDNNSPERDQDASYERASRYVQDGIGSLYEARERFRRGEINDATIGGMIGAYGLDAVGAVGDTLDWATFGGLSQLGEAVSRAGDLASTGIRRGVRNLTGNARLGQEAGDYAVLAGGMLIPARIANIFRTIRVEQGAAKLSTAAASSSTLVALDLTTVSRATAPIHRNSLRYVGETHLYVIRDSSGKILKYGESAAGKNQLGQSKRAQAQISKLEKSTPGKRFESEIIGEFDSKRGARTSESRYIKTHRKVFGKDSLPLNKNNR